MIAIDTIRAVWGVCQLVGAPLIAGIELGHEPDKITARVIRILGARQIVQGAILRRSPSQAAHRLGGCVDVLHTSTMVIVAIANPQRRRAAVIDGTIATCLAIAEFRR